jgi:hypothetical protein
MNGIVKDEVSIANHKISSIDCSIDNAHQQLRIPMENYYAACSVLNTMNSKLESLVESHTHAKFDLSKTIDTDSRGMIVRILLQLTSDITSLKAEISLQDIIVSDLSVAVIISKKKLAVANRVYREVEKSYSSLFLSSISLSGKAVRNFQCKLKLRYKAMSSTKGSSSNNAGDGPSFCDACDEDHDTKDCPHYKKPRDSNHSDCQPFVPDLNPVEGISFF